MKCIHCEQEVYTGIALCCTHLESLPPYLASSLAQWRHDNDVNYTPGVSIIGESCWSEILDYLAECVIMTDPYCCEN